jgi:uncharacterized membrane protein YbaN (DUF454 family)
MDEKKEGTTSRRLRRAFFVVVGSIFLCLGAIGIVVPILPTTPFLLLSAACYYRGSERLHRWMLNNRWFGSYIKNYKEGKGIQLRVKAYIITFLWITIGYSVFFVVGILIVQIILFIVAVAVSVYVLKLPTMRKK